MGSTYKPPIDQNPHQYYGLYNSFMQTINIFLQVLLTTRNIFIAILAFSDLLLCTFTMPLTLMDIITKFWAFGEDLVIKVGSSRGFNFQFLPRR